MCVCVYKTEYNKFFLKKNLYNINYNTYVGKRKRKKTNT